MALTLSPRTPPTTMYVQSTHQHHAAFPNRNTTNSNNRNFLPPIHLHRSTPPSASNPCRCRAVSPGRQPPPESEPPNGKDPSPSEGLTATFARLQDTVQIFFAVLFWMSLFFWSSVWDGRNNNGPGKGSRFRR
ncbi:uncharacterized protein LOC131312135 isoform X2 [Rhododendron vialii]|uniref:uncharacterized protein LOC131312135 isoform X2 n=1 Tax=Rhododendron vialii TaxID=182163 RepID=UPI00266020D4|nr:uncharacterized protein LOC131312135 isoform X2 [Rhododendron vialii]